MADTPSPSRQPNRLAGSTSPYLLQHAYNPVDWHPWGEEAIELARRQDRPIFLSVGYSACHWCHVMERESFENEALAAVLNESFVAIKVDREERPDLDEIYMTATQMMTHSGGWPMSVFLTPDLKPFYAGTYFPPEDRWGRPGFGTLLKELARAWSERREVVEEQAQRVTTAIRGLQEETLGAESFSSQLIADACDHILRDFDADFGGFGGAPKFPPSMRLELLLRRQAEHPEGRLERALTVTLDQMARGGMYDQIGGGFHRYSVDERWLVPHFEKMLYDNALLARVYALAHEQTGNAGWGVTAREILDYVLRDMTHPGGGFYSATDADSEGEEGRFFVWGPDEVQRVLGDQAGERLCRIYDITRGGNFEGHSIPNLLKRSLEEWAAGEGSDYAGLQAELAPLREKLRIQRETRVHPLLDDKVLAAWNGLMIRAFVVGARVFRESRYLDAARAAAGFCLSRMRRDGRLLRSYRAGAAQLNAYLEDYAALAVALLELHQLSGEPVWRDEGLSLLETIEDRFFDTLTGLYFSTSHDHEILLTRLRDLQDDASPSANALAALALRRALEITGEDRWGNRLRGLLTAAAARVKDHPAAYPSLLIAGDEYLSMTKDVIRPAGGGAVKLVPLISQAGAGAGERIWVGLRVTIRDGFHLAAGAQDRSAGGRVPARLMVQHPRGVELVTGSYPDPEEWDEPGQGPAAGYRGTVLFGVELKLPDPMPPGDCQVRLILQMQACGDGVCHPPQDLTATIVIPRKATGGPQPDEEWIATLEQQALAGRPPTVPPGQSLFGPSRTDRHD